MIDYVVELFSISSSGTTNTALGLEIITKMNNNSLNTTFSLTWKVLILYLVFILLFMSIFYFFKKTDSYVFIYN